MSFHSLIGNVRAVSADKEQASRMLERFMILIKLEDQFDEYFWAGHLVKDDETVILPLANALELTDLEQDIIRSFDAEQDLREKLSEIFALRFEESGVREDEFFDDFSDKLPWISTIDLIAMLSVSEIDLEANIAATGSIFSGMSVALPGSIEVLEKYRRDTNNSVQAFKLIRQIKRIEIDFEDDRRNYDEGYFDFQQIQDLIFLIEDESTLVKSTCLHFRDKSSADYESKYQIDAYLGDEIINIFLCYNKSGSAKIKTKEKLRMFAQVIYKDSKLYDGDDPMQLVSVLNSWCRSLFESHRIIPHFFSTEEKRMWNVEMDLAEKLLSVSGIGSQSAEALEVFLPIAKSGNIRAQCRIGYIFLSAAVGTRNFEKAIEWFKLSAMGGHAGAARNLAQIYYSGDGGIEIDRGEASKWSDLSGRLKEF